MDTFEKVKALKSKYKNYLAEQHPDWAESSVSTHVSDAFYIWNNSVLPEGARSRVIVQLLCGMGDAIDKSPGDQTADRDFFTVNNQEKSV